MKFPDFKMNYPNGSIALEIKGVDAELMESIKLGGGLLSMSVQQLPRLQPLINDFYEIWSQIQRLKK